MFEIQPDSIWGTVLLNTTQLSTGQKKGGKKVIANIIIINSLKIQDHVRK